MGRRRFVAGAIVAPVLLAGLAAAPPSAAAPHAPAVAQRTTSSGQVPHAKPVRPPRATGLAAYEDGSTVTLGWHLPADPAISRVIVRYARGRHAPQSPRTGTPAQLSSPLATTAVLSGLAADTVYSVAVWTRDRARRLSAPATTTFTTTERVGSRRGRLAGVVTDRRGDPLSGVAVTAMDYLADGQWATVTGADGKYALEVPVGSYELTFDGSRGQGGNSDSTGYVGDLAFVDVAARTVAATNAALRPGAEITGRVTDPQGNPLGGVAVSTSSIGPYVWPEGSSGSFPVLFSFVWVNALDTPTTTDQNGDFALRGIAHHAVLVCFDPSGPEFSDGSGGGVAYTRRCTSTSVLPEPGSTLPLATATLSPQAGGTIRGVVRDKAGNALPGADVAAVRLGGGYAEGWAQSAPDGSFRIAALPPGTYRLCVQSARVGAGSAELGYAPRCRRRTVPVADAQAASANITLLPGGAVSGTVRSADGAPVVDAQIEVRHGHNYAGFTATDSAGHWTVPGLPTGRYTVCATTENAVTTGSPTGVIGGCFARRAPVRVRRGANRIGIDLQLRTGGAITGRATQSDGRPIRWTALLAQRSDGSRNTIGELSFAGRGGYYRLTGLRPGTYRVCAAGFITSAYQSQSCRRLTVPVRVGRTIRHVDFTFAARGSLTAGVTDDVGRPLAGVDVAIVARCHSFCQKLPVFRPRSTVVASSTTNARGQVLLRAVRAGTYAVCAFAYDAAQDGGAPATGYADTCSGSTFDVAVVSGQRSSAELTLPVAGEVAGTVTDADGDPLSGVRVHVSNSAAADVPDGWDTPGDPTADAVTAADGTYAIRSVPAGDQTVCFDASEAVGGSAPAGYLSQCLGGAPGKHTGTAVPIVAGQVTGGEDLALTAAGGISGAVTDETGKRPRDRWLFVDVFKLHTDDEIGFGEVGGRGRYRIVGLAPGSYRVCFEASRYARQCYRDQPWVNGGPVPTAATPVPVASGAMTKGIDAVLTRG